MSIEMEDPVDWLQNFVDSHANGEWENIYKLTISLIDNPGWSIKCDIDTDLYKDISYSELNIERSEENWIRCWYDRSDSSFNGAGGVKNLKEIIQQFKKFEEMFFC